MKPFRITAVYLTKSVQFRVNASDRFAAYMQARRVANRAHVILVSEVR